MIDSILLRLIQDYNKINSKDYQDLLNFNSRLFQNHSKMHKDRKEFTGNWAKMGQKQNCYNIKKILSFSNTWENS